MQLTEQFHVPAEHHEACNRLTTLVSKHTQRLLEEEYWADDHLNAMQDHSGQSYTYIRDSDHDAFEDVDEYVYRLSRASASGLDPEGEARHDGSQNSSL
jgi:hypothetical protein